MAKSAKGSARAGWTPLADRDDRFSTGIGDLDRLLGGGYHRGSVALLRTDGSVGPSDLHVLLDPTFLNFLYQSRGITAVLPAREAPGQFREALLPYVSRRRFDSRVRIVDYIGEGGDTPYVVRLVTSSSTKAKRRTADMDRMGKAERDVQGATARPFLEYYALEVAETLFGADTAARMHFHGLKRVRLVKNLGIVLAREGLANLEAARSLADYELLLRRDEVGLVLRGLRPRIPTMS